MFCCRLATSNPSLLFGLYPLLNPSQNINNWKILVSETCNFLLTTSFFPLKHLRLSKKRAETPLRLVSIEPYLQAALVRRSGFEHKVDHWGPLMLMFVPLFEFIMSSLHHTNGFWMCLRLQMTIEVLKWCIIIASRPVLNSTLTMDSGASMGLSNNYELKSRVFGNASIYLSYKVNLCQAELGQNSLIRWNISPFLRVWTTESLQRRSDISIVHKALWTELMVHFIDPACCNLSIPTPPAAAECQAAL